MGYMYGFIAPKLLVVMLCIYSQLCDGSGYGEACNENTKCTGVGEICSTDGDAKGTCRCDAGYFSNSNDDGCIVEGKGCTVNGRTYMTHVFHFVEDCVEYKCRCKHDGDYFCDSKKKIC